MITRCSRFVTGMVDLSQTGVFKRSMYQAANHIGLPESFVELRHQATHDELPVLLVLRQAVTRSLKWLWQYYWRTIDIRSGALDSEDEAFVDGIMNLKDRFRSILRGYMEARMDVVKGKTSKPARDELTKTCQELVLICKGNDATLKMLATVLLECEFLIPADRL